MSRILSLALLATLVVGCKTTPEYGRPLPEGWPALLKLKPGEARPDFAQQWEVREEILPALERSITWMGKQHARQFYPIEGISHAHGMQHALRCQNTRGAA